MRILAKLFKNESGATAIEYGLLAALISVVMITAAGAIGDNAVTTFDTLSAAIDTE